ncbi:gamma-tubulin complex component 6 isoform X2 [Microtus oregoni]|uniref:gamma-tubulin complex component 6 isoform X2 n=1 Tax=Microtus oregoni TaxID=111838 RepID=UPI001BB26196|nr:gamma-tubulin complex component 6 isoform X2 [Microtus oregoni]
MTSITQLFDDLCEALLPAVQAHPGQRPVDRKRAKLSLKRVAYNALFANLFQEETHQRLPDSAKRPVKNKVLMLSFDLRVGGLGPEADRLEELVEKLEATPGCPLVEVESVLDLLVQLAGSGPPQVLRRKRDFFFNNKHAGRNVPYSGYDCYDLSVFEMDVRSLISGEEYLCHNMFQEALQVMEATPGTGLPTVGRFSIGDSCGDRFERDTRVSLFGALVHSRTYDMDVRLDLPPVPDSADFSGLAIKVPQMMDQWEDEGFQSASNLTPDSQSEPSMTPDLDLWEAVLTYEASKRRCWERIGCPPGYREEPYLTEAGRDAFDRFCRLCHGELQALSGGLLQAPKPVLVEESELVKDSLNVLLGVVSATFSLCQQTQAFVVELGVHVSGASPESIRSILSEVAEYGTYYTRLSHFSLQPVVGSMCSRGLVFQAFTSGIRRYLQYYRACVLSTPPTLSLLTIGFLFKKLGRQLRYLAELCGVGTVSLVTSGEPRAVFPTGVKLLSYLYQEALDNCSNEHYPVLLSLLKTSCEPYTRFIHDWVYSGVFRDVYREFMIQVNHEYLSFRDKFYWTHGYVLISKEVEDCVPVFLKHIAHDVYVCGKTINLLKLCCPRHYLCWSDVPVPRISVIFSLEELKEIEKDCAVYVGRMESVARHSSISKEEKELRMEIAKQELIVHAREAASRILTELSDRQMSEQMAVDTRKREQFQRLKEQFLKDQERRLAARQEELDDDFSYARELRDREKRLKALEEELERKARQALVDHYSKLSAEAARREQKALWRIQRHRLESARLRFLLEDQKRIQEMLSDMEAHQPQKPPSVFPSTCSQVTSPGTEHADEGRSSDLGSTEQCWDCLSLPGASTPSTHKSAAEGADNSGAGQAEGAGLFSTGLNITDFLPMGPGIEQPMDNIGAPFLEVALQTISSDLPPITPGPALTAAGPQPAQSEYDFNTVLRPTLATSSLPGPFQDVQNSLDSEKQHLLGDMPTKLDSCVHDMQETLPCPHLLKQDTPEDGNSQPVGQLLEHMSESAVPIESLASGMSPCQQLRSTSTCVSDASIKQEDYMSDVALPRPQWNIHGHVSEASIGAGENVSEVAPRRPRWNIHGHVSDASIKVGENVSDVILSRPRWNIHGHVSDASIRVGENVSDVTPSRPRWNVHGHVSKASIKVGENVSDVAPSRPRWNVHGHVSEASIKVGENVSDVAPSRPRWNVHGHVSEASIKVGENVSDVAPSRPRWNVHGHVSEASIKVGENVSDVAPSRPRWNVHGHVSEASIRIGENVSEEARQPRDCTQPPLILEEPLPEAEPDLLEPHQCSPARVSQSGLCEEAQSPVLECGPQLPKEMKPTTCCSPGSTEEGSPTKPPVVAEAGTLRNGIPEETGPGRNRDAEDLSPWPPSSQEDTAVPSSPGPSEELSDTETEARRWGKEQAYLADLTKLYHLEQYPDSYESMSEPPVAHLVHHMLPQAFAFPVDPQVQSAVDESAVQLSELLTLPVLMKRSLTAPLAAHVTLVNKAAVDYFFVELHLETHFEALRHFLLMEDGEFAQSLSDLLFEKLGAGQTPGELLNPLVLNSILSKALQYSLHGDTPHATNLSLALKYLPEVFAPNAPDVLSCLELRYKVDWPLNIVITESCLNKYSGIFSFLLQLKLMMWTLKDICFHLKRTALVSHTAGSVQFRQLQLFKHEMQHFVKVIQGYIANQILHVSWCEFRARLAVVGDLEEIQRAHAEYLHRAVFSIFSLVLKFRSQLISQTWGPATGPRGAEHPNFPLMQQSYSTFKYYSHFLFKVVTNLVNRGYQPHLEDFLLRINFNNYYQDS